MAAQDTRERWRRRWYTGFVATRADELVAAAAALAPIVGVSAAVLPLVRELADAAGWGGRATSARLLPSGVSHGVPWGLSLAVGVPALRVFIEAQADPATLAHYTDAGFALTAWMETRGADASRLRAMLAVTSTPLRLWHAAALSDAAPRWHAYICVPPDSPALAAALVAAAGIVLPPLPPDARVTIVSTDLARDGRAKAYVLLPAAALATLAQYAPDAVTVGAQLLGDRERRVWWLVAFGTPASCALHLGIPRHLSEPEARVRIAALLQAHELPLAPWQAATAALGAHHFVSFQRHAGAPRVTAYYLPRVARTSP